MKYPTMRFVFDRKKVATKTHKGLVQIEVLSINRKTFCDAFPNHFVSILHLLTQNELRFFIHFPTLLKGFSKSI